MKSKYDNYYYWENIVKKDISDNPFAFEPITEKSIFFHGVVINCREKSYERWLHFPNNEAVLGFLYYVFVSMAFFPFLAKETDLLVQGSLDEVLDIMDDSEKCVRKDLIPEIREFSCKLQELWSFDTEVFFDELMKFLVEYNKRWNKGLELFSYIDVFRSPYELGKYLVDAYENSEETDISMLEDQLGVTKDEWLNICSTVYENDFMKRKFTDILNNRIKDMV